jgi:hypothetical protein
MKNKIIRFLNKFCDKFFIKKWNVGYAKFEFESLISEGISEVSFKWLDAKSKDHFFADPFIFPNKDGGYHILYEDFSIQKQYADISITTLDSNLNVVSSKILLSLNTHLSYPNVTQQNGKTYIIPESSRTIKLLTAYEFDDTTLSTINPIVISNQEGLLDATILFYNNKYWLFANKRGENANSELYIYHSDRWDGDYTSHKENPVKKSLIGTRPAGNFIFHNGQIYRPAQNCEVYYGKSIILNKLVILNEDQYIEEPISFIDPVKKSKFNYGIHTINVSNDVIVIDGLERVFNPFIQIKTYLNNKHKKSPKI